VDARCARLGAVGVFKVDLPGERVRYRFAIFENPHTLPSVVVSPDVGRGFPRFNGASPSKRDAEVWFKKEVLEDEEWMRDSTGKARRIAQEVSTNSVGKTERVVFEGQVRPRSSASNRPTTGPPGETEIQRL